jgi:KDO2-lipid IV(A) lauroyltransferase
MGPAGRSPSLKRRLAFGSFSFLVGFIRFLPYPVYRVLARAAFTVLYCFRPKWGRVSLDHLDMAFGSGMSSRDKARVARDAYFNLALGLADVVKAAASPLWASARFDLDGRDVLDAALARGKGVIVCMAHFGPFAAMLYKFIAEGYPVSVVMRPPRSRYLREIFSDPAACRGPHTVYSVPLRSCVMESLKALNDGRLLFMPVDQNYGSAGRIFAEFFGRPAATAPGPVVYALRTGAPVLFAHALPSDRGRFRIVIGPEIRIIRRADARATLVYNTALINRRVEEIVRAYPGQWSWMHRRWKAVPKEGEI